MLGRKRAAELRHLQNQMEKAFTERVRIYNDYLQYIEV